MSIVDGTGAVVVSYEYDPYGNILSTTGTLADTLGVINPLRYRGYVYDQETDLYYLQSRYYDPGMGRLINADSYATTGQGVLGNNMFAYCGNNPVNNIDPFGTISIEIIERLLGILAEFLDSESSVGAARPYEALPGSNDPNSPNCYAFAIGSSVNEQPGRASGRIPSRYDDVYEVFASVKADLNAMGYTVRQISGPNGKILDNEYRVALRVGTSPDPCMLAYYGVVQHDYHFMVQTSTGAWAEKHGTGGPSICWDNGLTPDQIPWTLHDHNYYDSEIIYFAVGK